MNIARPGPLFTLTQRVPTAPAKPGDARKMHALES